MYDGRIRQAGRSVPPFASHEHEQIPPSRAPRRDAELPRLLSEPDLRLVLSPAP